MKSRIHEIKKNTILNLSKKSLILSLAAFSFFSCSKKETKEGNVHISGDIKGLSQGKLYIQKIEDTTLVKLDSIIFKGNSKFESFVNVDSPEVLYLFLDRGETNSLDNSLPVFVEPGEIVVTTKLKEFFNAAEIKGSKNHDLWNDFKKMNVKFTNENLSIMEKRLQNELNFNAERQDSINSAYEKLIKRKYLYVANFATNHADYEIAPYLALTEIPDINIRFLETIANKMSPQVAESKYGKILKEHINKIKNTNQ